MAASDEANHAAGAFQVQAHEGPCQDCFRKGHPVIEADLTTADQWPQFAPHAVAAGFRSVHAFPMRLRDEVIGALNLFGNGLRMSGADIRVVQALADVATIGLLQERAIQQGEVLTERLQAALNSRMAIEQAKGVLAQIHAVSPAEAFELMRAFSRRHRLRLGEVARPEQAATEDPARHPAATPRRLIRAEAHPQPASLGPGAGSHTRARV